MWIIYKRNAKNSLQKIHLLIYLFYISNFIFKFQCHFVMFNNFTLYKKTKKNTWNMQFVRCFHSFACNSMRFCWNCCCRSSKKKRLEKRDQAEGSTRQLFVWCERRNSLCVKAFFYYLWCDLTDQFLCLASPISVFGKSKMENGLHMMARNVHTTLQTSKHNAPRK